MQHVWTCQCCGKQFDSLPLDFAAQAPLPWLEIPAEERAGRGNISTDVCIIDRKDFFIRACLEIPILDHDEVFVWGTWVSVSRASFIRIDELWDANDVEQEPPIFGWLCDRISIYPETYGLKTHLYLRSGGKRPLIVLEPTDHPLAVEQRNGITLQRVEEIASKLLTRH
jgi:hypothetical protein